MKEKLTNDFKETVTKQVYIEDHHQTVVREYKLRSLNEYKKLLKSIVILEQATELTLGLNQFIDIMDFHVVKNLLFATSMGEVETSNRLVGVSEVYSAQGDLTLEFTIDDMNSLVGALTKSKEFTDAESVYLWEIENDKKEQ